MNIFSSVSPTHDQLAAMDALRRDFEQTNTDIEALAPPGRYKSLAVTYLEIAAMFANKAITHRA